MKEIAIIGNINSVWIKRYIENVLLPESVYKVWLIDLFSYKFEDVKFREFYADNNVEIIKTEKAVNRCKNIIERIYVLNKLSKTIAHKSKIQIVHVHLVNWPAMYLMKKIKKEETRCVVTYWGSDILRSNKTNSFITGLFLRFSDVITLSTKAMEEAFFKVYGHKYDHKIASVLFGISGYYYIDAVLSSNTKLSNSNDLINIVIGYNGAKQQQHIDVIKCLGNLPPNLKKQFNIIIPMTYGLKEMEYKNEIKSKLEDSGFGHYEIITEFLDDMKFAELICCSNFFIHAQLTDALSATLQEFLYAEKMVFSPSWIKYNEFDDIGVIINYFDSFDELSKKIIDYINSVDNKNIRNKLSQNHEILKKFNSWSCVSKKWLSIYEQIN